MQQELPKVYNPTEIEDKIYKNWLEKKYFHAEVSPERQSFTIVIPPPNVTDVLHMGHAYNNTIQDILIRFKRMQGMEALWLPGTDHAGIATQNVVERFLRKEKKQSRHDVGREKFIDMVWDWKNDRGNKIVEQLKKLGFSCDWDRLSFTMDDHLSKAVLEVFVRLFEKGLIYKGKYIINWCPRCQTALSEEEVEHQDTNGNLWYINYPVKDSSQFVTVATTRPETMLGDVAVAVHPDDKRYKKLIGKTLILPVVGRELKIIADDMVDKEFGTGAVKITPAHDPNDFLMGRRHNLTPINVMNEDATMNELAGKFEGMDRLKARKNLLQELKEGDYLKKVEDHQNSVGHCYRCSTVVEPYLSEQWFVKMKPLAEPALAAVKAGKIKLHPARWQKVFIHWLDNIHDWCISRQIWWGHRIPIYTCKNCNEVMAAVETPTACKKCGKGEFEQETDVLDTWFSSQLWPLATLGWPEETEDLKYFYPTDTLVTAPDIIFFWVSRMVMMGLELRGEVPFNSVYFNGIIRDKQGRKMSKSLGNGINPLKMVDKYSADAVRYSLLDLSSEGKDINLSENDFEVGRNFSNKVWNAFRFLWMNLEESDIKNANAAYVQSAFDDGLLDLSDKWILSRYQKAIKKITRGLEQFKLHETAESIYTFFWSEYCDWYLEFIKPRLYGKENEAEKRATLTVATYVMKGMLQLLHPLIPFITEELWQNIRNEEDAESIMISSWPIESRKFISAEIEREVGFVQSLVGAVRNIRGEMNVAPNKSARVVVIKEEKNGFDESAILASQPYLQHLAKVSALEFTDKANRPKNSANAIINKMEILVPLEGLIDFEVERARLQKEIIRVEKQLEGLNTKLHSSDFINRAPEEIVEGQKKKKVDFEFNLAKLKSSLESIAA